MAFLILTTLVHFSACAAIDTLTCRFIPGMRNLVEDDVAGSLIKAADAILAAGLLAAIERTAAHQRSKLRYRHAIHLIMQDMVKALLHIGNLFGETIQQPLGYLTKKHTALAERVEKLHFTIAPNLLWQKIEHAVGYLRRREHLIVAQIGKATEHIGIIIDHGRED